MLMENSGATVNLTKWSGSTISHFFAFLFLAVSIYYYPEDWMGWLVFVGSFYCIANLNIELKLKRVLFLCLCVHQCFSLYYWVVYAEYIRGVDATAFHLTATTLAEWSEFSFGMEAALFANLLALVYKINASQLFGQELMLACFMFSSLSLLNIVRYYKLTAYALPILLIYNLSPAYLLWTAVILREPFELALLLLAVECWLYFRAGLNRRWLHWLAAVALLCFICLLHKGLLLSLPLFFIFALVLPWRKDKIEHVDLSVFKGKKLLMQAGLLLFPAVLLLSVDILNISKKTPMDAAAKANVIYKHGSVISEFINRVAQKGLVSSIHYHRAGSSVPLSKQSTAKLVQATTNYDKLDYSPETRLETVSYVVKKYIMYSIYPAVLISKKITLIGVYLSLLWIFRLCLIVSACYLGWKLYQQRVYSVLSLAILFALISGGFALGTTAYGTALRHHMMTDWIIFVLGVPGLISFLCRLRQFTYSTKGTCVKHA